MEHRALLPDLDTLRDRVVSLALALLLCLTAPMLMTSIYRSWGENWNWYASVQVMSYVALLIGTLFLHPTRMKLLSHLIVASVMFTGICGIAAWGPAPSRFVVLCAGCVFSALFNGARVSIGVLASSIVLISFAAYLNPIVQILDGGDSVSEHLPMQWLVTVASFAFYTAICSLLVAWVARSLQRTIVALKGREEELANSNKELQSTAVQLEEQAVVLEEQTESLKIERDKSAAAAAAKDRFLSVVSHELRTPLNPIIGFLDLLREDESISSESRAKLELMRRSSEHLLHLIDKVVDFSELDPRELTFNRKKTTWSVLKKEMQERLKPQADERQLEFLVSVPESENEAPILDVRRTMQVIEELCTNGLNFTKRGGVTIELSSNLREGKRHWMTVVVSDSGCGMDEATLAGLFDSFTQSDGSRTRTTGGFGLGLSICQTIVSAMGGSIKVKSELAVGSVFTVELPVDIVRESTRLSYGKVDRPFFSEPISVLVAEDNVMNQKVVKGLLKRIGAKATCVEDGQQAVSALLDGQFDVVLMDISMPVMDGLSATREIRLNRTFDGTPIIALTAHSYAKCEQDCFEAGMNGFLTKPVKVDELFEAVAQALASRKAYDSSVSRN